MRVVFEFECGETTCATPDKKMCDYVRAHTFGTRWHCALFDRELHTSETEGRGWLLRCSECIKKGEDDTKQGSGSDT